MATKITSGSIFSAGAVVTGVDADAPPAVPSPSPEPAPEPAPTASWVVVGAYGNGNSNGYDGGAAYVYDANDLSAQPTKLIAFDGDQTTRFGNSVAATTNKIFVRSKTSGSVYVYNANDLDDQPTKINIPSELSTNTSLGDLVVVDNNLIVGSFKSSEVYVFDTNDLFATPTILTPFDGFEGDRFGWSVAATADKIVVGSSYDDDKGQSSGSAYVYDANDLTAQPTKLTAFDGAANDRFGSTVSAFSDKIFISAYGDDNSSGSVYVYDANDLSSQPTKLTSFDGAADDRFGNAVALG
jgi:hypothetical protein